MEANLIGSEWEIVRDGKPGRYNCILLEDGKAILEYFDSKQGKTLRTTEPVATLVMAMKEAVAGYKPL